jgi:hypothetical protein
MHDVFDEIREACAQVSAGARWVRIDHERLGSYADELCSRFSTIGGDDPGRERFDDLETTVAFVVSLDAINFGSGWFPELRKPAGLSGYRTVATAWRAHVTGGGPIGTGALRALTPETCASIFGQPTDAGSGAFELMGHFATALRDLAAAVDERHDGSFVRLVESAGHSAAAFVGELDRIPFFHDVSTWHGLRVPLYKRAQITVNDLAYALDGHPLGRFDDLDRLTMFPDNLVPHVLRVDGVLRFDPELVRRIDAVEDIAAGSEPEVEIRAVGLHAVALLAAALRARGVAAHERDLDTFLWNRGGGPTYKAVPRHRSRCVFY